MIDKEIKTDKDCMGCQACSNICPVNSISMKKNSEGFWYPYVNYETCIGCGKCVDVCPIINFKQIDNKPHAYACINNNEHERMKSSSGGIFSIIANWILTENGIVYGAAFDDNFNVIHKKAESVEELDELRGSKYVQSWIGSSYKEIKSYLNQGRKILLQVLLVKLRVYFIILIKNLKICIQWTWFVMVFLHQKFGISILSI